MLLQSAVGPGCTEPASSKHCERPVACLPRTCAALRQPRCGWEVRPGQSDQSEGSLRTGLAQDHKPHSHEAVRAPKRPSLRSHLE